MHFLMKTLKHLPTEISLHALGYHVKRRVSLLGIAETMLAMRLTRVQALLHARAGRKRALDMLQRAKRHDTPTV